MSFEDNFPSLKNNENVVLWSKDAKELLMKYCLDKQRVREAFSRNAKDGNYVKFCEELGL